MVTSLIRDQPVGLWTCRFERKVGGIGAEPVRVLLAQVQSAMSDVKLRKTVVDAGHDPYGIEAVQFVQQLGAKLVVHRAAVVRVDQRQIPKLPALVEIRNAGRRVL